MATRTDPLTILRLVAADPPEAGRCAFCTDPALPGVPFCLFCAEYPIDIEGTRTTTLAAYRLLEGANPASREVNLAQLDPHIAQMVECGCFSRDAAEHFEPVPGAPTTLRCPDCGAEVECTPEFHAALTSGLGIAWS